MAVIWNLSIRLWKAARWAAEHCSITGYGYRYGYPDWQLPALKRATRHNDQRWKRVTQIQETTWRWKIKKDNTSNYFDSRKATLTPADLILIIRRQVEGGRMEISGPSCADYAQTSTRLLPYLLLDWFAIIIPPDTRPHHQMIVIHSAHLSVRCSIRLRSYHNDNGKWKNFRC